MQSGNSAARRVTPPRKATASGARDRAGSRPITAGREPAMSPSLIHRVHACCDHAAPARTPRAPLSPRENLGMTIRVSSANRRLTARAYSMPVVRELPSPRGAPDGDCTW
jgi:hypothetical protein